ncbi:energy transducer TonB [Rhodanobacter sp. AS-Z3]|uniref:energy transducer TonB n=1 Tax=Rhodanobacter sp. AS-Z3 TaxID=3031330 RepID=UPI00247847EF|nr:energy transducer TonB [Rhodanobacter sp. AS-Z3]WEN15973.1 energy transducer TonB [Rhodanobacter sp. AS-Z3]
MKSWLIGLFCLFTSVATVAAGPAARERVQASMLLTGTIVVAPDGSVRSYAIDHADKVEPAVTALIGRTVPAWHFQPVLLDGKPVAAKASMSLRVVALPIGNGNYQMSISGSHFGQDEPGTRISSDRQEHPRYPEQAARANVAGTVYLVLRVGRTGQVEEAAAEQVNLAVVGSDAMLTRWRKAFAESALEAARTWTFHPPTKGSHVNQDHWVARVPVRYFLRPMGSRNRDEYGKWEMYVPGPKELVPWVDDKRLLSGSADALPGDGIYQLDDDGLRLITPVSGA